MKYSEVVQLERLLEKYKDVHANKTMKSKIDFLVKQVHKKAEELKDTGYRFFVCKKAGEYIPVAGPYKTLDKANAWILENGSATKEKLFGVKVPKDCWGKNDIEEVA